MKLGVMANLNKNNAEVALRALVSALDGFGATYAVEARAAGPLGIGVLARPEAALLEESDVLIAVGGDGTIIHTAKKAAAYHKPVLGINAGRVGYMACLELEEIPLLSRLFSGDYVVERRMMLEATVSTQPDERYYCLNEVDVSKSDRSRMLELAVDNGGETFMTLRSDGILVSTPTGSTAYAMSAGGPVTDPTLDCMILVPVCSMSMYSRGFVLSADSELSIRLVPDEGTQAAVKFDGGDPILLPQDAYVTVRRAQDRETRLIKIKDDSFYTILKKKMTDL